LAPLTSFFLLRPWPWVTPTLNKHRVSHNHQLFLLQLTCCHLSLPEQQQICEDMRELDRFCCVDVFLFLQVILILIKGTSTKRKGEATQSIVPC
jgi:hypothetical protein